MRICAVADRAPPVVPARAAECSAGPHERLLARPRTVPRPPGPGQGLGPPSRAKKPHRRSTPLGGPPGDSTRTQGRDRSSRSTTTTPCSSRATKSASGGPARRCSPSRLARSALFASHRSLQGLSYFGILRHSIAFSDGRRPIGVFLPSCSRQARCPQASSLVTTNWMNAVPS